MALDDTQKAAIRLHLGYPDVGTQPDFRLESAMNVLSAAGEVQVEGILARLTALETAEDNAAANGAYERVEDVVFRSNSAPLAAARDRLVGQLAATLGVQPRATNTCWGSGPLPRG